MVSLIYKCYSLNAVLKILKNKTNEIKKVEDLYRLVDEQKITLSLNTKDKDIALIPKKNIQQLVDHVIDLPKLTLAVEDAEIKENEAVTDQERANAKEKRIALLERKSFVRESIVPGKLWSIVKRNDVLDITIDSNNLALVKDALLTKHNKVECYILYCGFLSKLKYNFLQINAPEICLRKEDLKNLLNIVNPKFTFSTSKKIKKASKSPVKESTKKKYAKWQKAVDKKGKENKYLTHSAICIRIASELGANPGTISRNTAYKK